jgi:2-haloacid dehalogenase
MAGPPRALQLVIDFREHTMFDFSGKEVLTFDCYGTLIDWETGILEPLRGIFEEHGVEASDDHLLEAHARHETRWEAGPYLPYREILARTLRDICADHGITATEGDMRRYADAAATWPPFADSHDALVRLASRFRLGVITNCDDDIFEASRRRLAIDFEWVATAQAVGAYKPSLRNFEFGLAAIDRPREVIMHVAQSLFHDHVPARRLGLATAWIDRRQAQSGFGATPPANAQPDLVVPDMASFAALAEGDAG